MQLDKRLTTEARILAKYFPTFAVQTGVVTGTLTSNSETTYGIRLDTPSFPEKMPSVYVTSPVLYTHDGRRLSQLEPSGRMHILNPDPAGNPQICHWHPRLWATDVTLYQVIMKARVWLEAWEQHRLTGQPLDRYLPHT